MLKCVISAVAFGYVSRWR